MNESLLKRMTGVAVPLGALWTKESPAIGEFPALKKFAAFCKSAGLKIIQLLPVNDTGTQSSPYSGLSAFALHPIYVCLKDLPEFAALYKSDKNFKTEYDLFIQFHPYKNRYDYQGILDKKIALLMRLYQTTDTAQNAKPDAPLAAWIKKNDWIKAYAVYKNLKWKYMQATWKAWKKEDQVPGLEEIEKRWKSAALKKDQLFYAWLQMRAHEQFADAAAAVKKAGIILKGDMPIMMNEDSCDAWALPEFFDHTLRAGSPVDGQNPTGQNWGFPTYNWKNLKAAGFSWWTDRLKSAEQYYQAYRLDHILGFFRIWAIPERETTALLGRSEPGSLIARDELIEAGFNEGRIHWLAEPHVPTSDIDYFTWNHDASTKILEKVATKLPGEELWNFKSAIKGDKDIYEASFEGLCQKEAEQKIKEALAKKWRDRTLREIKKDKFVALWTYKDTYPWSTLNDDEKKKLQALIDAKRNKEEGLWKKQAQEILGELTKSVGMVPCGEDLGVGLAAVPQVMGENKILRLNVVRWSRDWQKENSPYIQFEDYPELSVATTSVHDSSTIRQWWNEEKESAAAFFKANGKFFADNGIYENDFAEFTEKTARAILQAAASAKSVWAIHPLQDFLYLQKKYWLDDAKKERVNIPGEVSEFNWTYRMPASVEELADDKNLLDQINFLAKKRN
ncbi:MAG: 4-alpha-glucanotransferase [Treponema sp.]|nr:4-alpha-glucanotransferase [Treponema sp.]